MLPVLDAVITPFTYKAVDGVATPIPTLPPASIVILVVLFVSKLRLLLSFVPRFAAVPKELPFCWKKLAPRPRDEVATEINLPVASVPIIGALFTFSSVMSPFTSSFVAGDVVPMPTLAATSVPE